MSIADSTIPDRTTFCRLVVNGAQMGTILASDWSSDVRGYVMGGNRGPGVKRDRGLTGSHVMWETADQ